MQGLELHLGNFEAGKSLCFFRQVGEIIKGIS